MPDVPGPRRFLGAGAPEFADGWNAGFLPDHGQFAAALRRQGGGGMEKPADLRFRILKRMGGDLFAGPIGALDPIALVSAAAIFARDQDIDIADRFTAEPGRFGEAGGVA